MDVAGPGVECARDPLGRRLLAGQLFGPHGDQLVAGALEQPLVQRELGREVVIDHRRGDAGAAGDLVHPGAVVAAFGEHLQCGLLDEFAAGLGRQTFARGGQPSLR